MMLGIRFVNFDYCIGDSLITLAAVLAILVFVPSIAAVVPPVFLIPLHFAAFLAVLFMTTSARKWAMAVYTALPTSI